MSFFKKFPLRRYTLPNNDVALVTDIFRHIIPNEIVTDNLINYRYYDILEGDRPDTVSQKLYGTPDYYWTFFLINDSLKEGLKNWPGNSTTREREKEFEYSNYGSIVAIPSSATNITLADGSTASLGNTDNTLADVDFSYNKIRAKRNGKYADIINYNHDNLQLVLGNFNNSPREKGLDETARTAFFAGNPNSHSLSLVFSDLPEYDNTAAFFTNQLVPSVDEARFRFVEGLVNRGLNLIETAYQGAGSISAPTRGPTSGFGVFDGKDSRASTINPNRTNDVDGQRMDAKYPLATSYLSAEEFKTFIGTGFTVNTRFRHSTADTGYNHRAAIGANFVGGPGVKQIVAFGKDFWGMCGMIIGTLNDEIFVSFGVDPQRERGDQLGPKFTNSRFKNTSAPGVDSTTGKLQNGEDYSLTVRYDGYSQVRVILNGTDLSNTDTGGWSSGRPFGELMVLNRSDQPSPVGFTIGAGSVYARQDDNSPIAYNQQGIYGFDGRIYFVEINDVNDGPGYGKYLFNEGQGNILYDSSGNNHHLLIQPGTAFGPPNNTDQFFDSSFSAVQLPQLQLHDFNSEVESNGSPTAAAKSFIGSTSAIQASRSVNPTVVPTRMYSNHLLAPAYYTINGDSPEGRRIGAYEASGLSRLDDFTSNFEYLDAEYENNRRIRVIKPALIEDFVKQYRDLIGII